MARILEAIHLTADDSELRPDLYTALTALGFDTTFPFKAMEGLHLDFELDGMMDRNVATPAMKLEESRALQSALRASDTQAIEAGSAGQLRVVASRKPKLTKPVYKGRITTATAAIAALHNAVTFYDTARAPREAGLLTQHTASMRQLWARGRFMHDDKAFVDFEQRLRSLRCRTNGSPATWTLDAEVAGAEQHLLTECIHGMETARINAMISGGNSSRPPEVPGAAEDKGARERKKEKDRERRTKRREPAEGAGKCYEWLDGRCFKGADCKFAHGEPKPRPPRVAQVPDEFASRHGGIKPNVCMQFAYHGKCPRGTGDACENSRGPRLHTCVHCRFAKGPHAIKDGVGPGGKCP
jgi:hypothetical protein